MTGGSRGIGRAIAIGLAREGADVCIGYSSSEKEAAEVVREVQGLGRKGYMVRVDQANLDEAVPFAERCISLLGGVDVLVNNAGICPFKPFFEIDKDLLVKVMNVNFLSHFLITQVVARHMVSHGVRGRILMISSISAHVGGLLQTHYTPTKSALNGLVHSLAIALGPHGILVNSLEPGTIVTDINREDLSDQEKRRYMEKRTVLGRLGDPEDMVGPALFLLSDENTYTTGTSLLSDGGMLVNLQ
ncbi:glucose-1-dehydrogenase [Thermogymnomonas acidicola]|uniref:Glucose-1-dehydrogenase n=1 Tax=Thermogymnomonas acidicola TaxID=399579 RepID=A0AA37BQ04_9ARCH|nr:glucose-1-dehydrogenase [Thermogymnomonas acidicola]